jgi:uncharacterized coiled-coil protein SlyX
MEDANQLGYDLALARNRISELEESVKEEQFVIDALEGHLDEHRRNLITYEQHLTQLEGRLQEDGVMQEEATGG